MIQQDDLSGLSDEELARIAGVTLQPPSQQQQAAPRQQAAYNGPTDAASLMPALIAQESGGRAGVLGPQTRYGRAIGRTQMLPGTAREMAGKVGLPFDESLLRGTSPEAAAYQDRLGQAYLEEGLHKTGNVRDALMYYHGGPDRRLWGPKTQAYAGEVLARVGQDQPSMQSASAPQDDLEGLSDEELMQLAGIAPQDAPQDVVIDQGVMNVNGRAMIGNRDMGPFDEYWSNLEAKNAARASLHPVLQEERAKAAQYADLGHGPNFASQTTAPLNDELGAVAGFASQGVENLGRRLMGRDIEVSAMDRGRAMSEVAREQQKAFAKEHPWQSGVGQALGGFAFAPARAAGAASAVNGFARPAMGQAYGQAAAIGGGYGVADAEGGLQNRAMGGVEGAALGVATAGLIDGGTRLIPRGRGALQPNENRVAEALNRELRSNRMTPQDILSAMHSAPEGTLPLNLGRGALSGAAEVIAQSPGPGRQVVMDALRQQRATSGDRIGRRVQEALGGEGNYFAALDSQIAQRRQAANKVMGQIEGRAFSLSQDAVTALRSDLAQSELRKAASFGLASPDEAVRNNAANLNRLADTLLDNPAAAQLDLRNAQTVSKALLDASSDAWRAGDGARGQALGGLGRAVRQNASDAVPEYGQWLKRYGDDSSQIEALELGRSVLRNVDDPRPDGVSAEVLRKQVSEMSDTAKDLFRKGVGEAIVARSRTSKGGVGAMRDILRSQELGDRLRIAFPDEQAYTRFLNAAEAEAAMGDAANGILGNSRTAFRQGAAKRMGADDYGQVVDSLGDTTLTGAALELGRQGIKSVSSKFAKNRSVLENDNLNELFAKALTEPELLRQMLQGQRPRRGLFGGRAPAGVAGAIPSAVF